MGGLFADFGFTISVFLALTITAAFAFVVNAPLQLVVSMPVMGVFTAIAEYGMRPRQQPPWVKLKGWDESVTSKGYRK